MDLPCVAEGLWEQWAYSNRLGVETSGLVIGHGEGTCVDVHVRCLGFATGVRAYCQGHNLSGGVWDGSRGKIMAEWHTHLMGNPPSGDDLWQLVLAYHARVHNHLLVLCETGWWELSIRGDDSMLLRVTKGLLGRAPLTMQTECAVPSASEIKQFRLQEVFNWRPMSTRSEQAFKDHANKWGVCANFLPYT